MSKNPFDLGGFGSIFNSINGSIRFGAKVGQNFKIGSLKRRLTAEGYSPITIAEAVAALRNGQPEKIDAILYHAKQQEEAKRAKAELMASPPKLDGSAEWTRTENLSADGLLTSSLERGDGIYLGTPRDHSNPLYWCDEGHLMTLADTRTGKSIFQIIPNLLQYRGSAVVLDPKGELFATTSKWRNANVGPVYVVNPFEDPALDSFTHAFNPLDAVQNETQARTFAEILYPRGKDNDSSSGKGFFDSEAISVLTALVLDTAKFAEDEHRTVGTIRDITASEARLYDHLETLSISDIPAIRNGATAALGIKRESRNRLVESINTHLQIWDTQGLRRVTDQSTFSFESLKDQPSTVYLILPFEQITPYANFIQLLFNTALGAMTTNRTVPDIPVLFLLDEFLSLGKAPKLVDGMRTHTGYGVRFWYFLQGMPALQELYPNTWKAFHQPTVKSYFGIKDHYTAEDISKGLGKYTMAYNTGAETSGASGYSLNDSIAFKERQLLTPDEVLKELSPWLPNKERNGIVMLDHHSITVRHRAYFNDPLFSGRVGAMPLPS